MDKTNNNSFLLKINSKYILKKIFNNIKQNRFMKLIQYNKLTVKRDRFDIFILII